MAQQCGQLKWELVWVAAASCVAFPNSRAGNAEFVVYHKVSPVGRILRKRLVQPPTKAGSALGSDQVAQDVMQLSLEKKLQGWGLYSLSGQCMTVLIMKKLSSGLVLEMCSLSSSCRLCFAYIPPKSS